MFQVSNSFKNRSYQEWLDSEIVQLDDLNGMTHKEYVIYYINNLLERVENSGYKINNIKEFKDEIASHIYSLSEKNLDNARRRLK
mgnify:CR=1 FL=1|tara:strand:- start:180 stop:434 length:255 start_codon:yes stop_codon:yes gene_type:complete